jgi:hypothetical protein
MAQNVKSVNGLAIASVKSFDGLAIASVKSILGVDNTGGGSSLQFDQMGAFDDTLNFSFYTYLANQYVAASSYTLDKVVARLIAIGTPSAGTITAKIYTSSGGNPVTLVGTGSGTVDRTTVSGTVDIDFTGMNVTISNGTTYFVLLQASATDSEANGVRWIKTNNGTITTRASADGSSWDNVGTAAMNFELWGS